MKMEAALEQTTACFMVDDDILNFSLDDEEKYPSCSFSNSSLESSSDTVGFLPHDHNRPFHECVEEELEWLSNKDAFPAVEFDIFSDNVPSMIIFDHHSPVSVLENSSSSSSNNISNNGNGKENALINGCGGFQVPVNYPVRARSKGTQRKRRTVFAELTSESCAVWRNQAKLKNNKQELGLVSIPMTKAKKATSMGRRCQHCGVDKTPQWRAGPMGPKTLCNACGVRYKSGKLLPEYRPANSPTFSADLHSNSHRKVLEMRKQKIGV